VPNLLDPADPTNVFLTESQLDERHHAKKGHSAEQRNQGKGPKFLRLSPRMIRYRLSDVLEFEAAHTFKSTAEELEAQNTPTLPAPAKNHPETA
jgi:hypothetical protein